MSKEKRISIRLTSKLAKLLHDTSDQLDLPVAKIVRDSLQFYLSELQTGHVREHFLNELVKSREGRLEKVIIEAIKTFSRQRRELRDLEKRKPTEIEKVARDHYREG